MEKISTVTKKGQVTIPQVVREKMNITYGEKIEFVTNEKGEVVLKPLKTDLNDIYGALQDRKPEGTHEEHRKSAQAWAAGKRLEKE
jgi:AbrB family looped-hinge helix DNA binding protein